MHEKVTTVLPLAIQEVTLGLELPLFTTWHVYMGIQAQSGCQIDEGAPVKQGKG